MKYPIEELSLQIVLSRLMNADYDYHGLIPGERGVADLPLFYFLSELHQLRCRRGFEVLPDRRPEDRTDFIEHRLVDFTALMNPLNKPAHSTKHIQLNGFEAFRNIAAIGQFTHRTIQQRLVRH